MSPLLLSLLLLTPVTTAAEPADPAPAEDAAAPDHADLEARLLRLERLLGLAPTTEPAAEGEAADEEVPPALDDTTVLRQAIRDVRLELLRLDQRLDALERVAPAGAGTGGADFELRRLEREVADLRSRVRSLEMRR